MPPHYSIAHADTGLSEDPTNYPGLSSAKFNTPTGTQAIPGVLSIYSGEGFKTLAYTLENPNRVTSNSYNYNSLPAGANESMIASLLAFSNKYSLSQIHQSTGIQASEIQVREATQLAVWNYASKFQTNYQIDNNSIKDATVRTLATEITSWATKQVGQDTHGVLDTIFPVTSASLVTDNAKINKSENFLDYGPYSIRAQSSAMFQLSNSGQALIIDESFKQVTAVKGNQIFYVRYPVAYNGTKNITFMGKQAKYSLGYINSRVYLNRDYAEDEVSFTLGGHSNNSGTIQVQAIDAITKEPVPDVIANVSTTSVVGTLQTDDKGIKRFETGVGKYNVSFKVPDGYLTPEPVEVEIKFTGDVQVINLKLNWSKSIVNFKAIDSNTLAPAGDSEALIYDESGKAIKRIALKDGKANGITFEEGVFNLVQYKSNNGYSINTGTKFQTTGGKIQEVTILQDSNNYPTTINIKGSSNNVTWVYTVSKGSDTLFKLNGTSSMKLDLPSGSYNIKATRQDGTITTPLTSFTTNLNAPTEVELLQRVGEKTVSITYVDTKEKKPIPNLVVGLFDENHNLLQQQTANDKGKVTFNNLEEFDVYYVNILAAPESVSGYSANGNRFLGADREYTLELYSQSEIKEITNVDTIYRVPNVTYQGISYTYPQ